MGQYGGGGVSLNNDACAVVDLSRSSAVKIPARLDVAAVEGDLKEGLLMLECGIWL
jgi:hypothetical protein